MPQSRRSIHRARHDAAAHLVSRKLIDLRLKLALSRLERSWHGIWLGNAKYDPSQPRVPAGHPDGGQWTDGGGGSAPAGGQKPRRQRLAQARPDKPRVSADGWHEVVRRRRGQDEVTLQAGPGGAEVYSRRSTAKGDSDHLVKLADGAQLIIRNRNGMQQIIDGEGHLIAATRWGANGPEPIASVQPANALALPFAAGMGPAAPPVILGSLILYAGYRAYRWSQMPAADAPIPIISFRVRDYQASDDALSLDFVGEMSREETDKVCRRYPEVRRKLTEYFTELQPSFVGQPTELGKAVHKRMDRYVRSLRDDNFVSEITAEIPKKITRRRFKGASMLDIYERVSPDVACVYDHKTGKAGLRPKRAQQLVTTARRIHPGVSRVLIIETRPES